MIGDVDSDTGAVSRACQSNVIASPQRYIERPHAITSSESLDRQKGSVDAPTRSHDSALENIGGLQ